MRRLAGPLLLGQQPRQADSVVPPCSACLSVLRWLSGPMRCWLGLRSATLEERPSGPDHRGKRAMPRRARATFADAGAPPHPATGDSGFSPCDAKAKPQWGGVECDRFGEVTVKCPDDFPEACDLPPASAASAGEAGEAAEAAEAEAAREAAGAELSQAERAAEAAAATKRLGGWVLVHMHYYEKADEMAECELVTKRTNLATFIDLAMAKSFRLLKAASS